MRTLSRLTAILTLLACLLLIPRTVYAESDIPEEIKDNGIPVLTLTIDPDDYDRIVNSEDHSEKAGGTISIDVPDGYKGDFSDVALEDMGPLELDYIRGRGNATWTYDKKPFKLKLAKKANLLGMGSNKHWALLANYNDGTFMRNRLVSYIGRHLGLEYEMKMLPVDFVVNGNYMGNYLLSQTIRIDKTRVEIDELTSEDIGEPNVTGGYLLAMSPYPTEPEANTFTTSRGVRFQSDNPVFASNDPSETLGEPEQRDYIFDYLQKVEDALYGDDLKDQNGVPYSDYMDLKSSADYWWVQEFTANSDAFVTDSTHLYKKRSGKLYWGPLWDFDMSTYTGFPGEGFGSADMPWLDYMRAYDPAYQKILKEEWSRFSAITEDITKEGGILDQYKEETRESWKDDYLLWRNGNEEDEFRSEDLDAIFDEEVEGLREYYKNRTAWIDANIDTPAFTDILSKVTFEVDGVIYAAIFVHKDGWIDEDMLPTVPEKEGYLFLGWLDPEGNPLDSDIDLQNDLTLTASFVKEEDAIKASDVYFDNPEVWVDFNETEYIPYFTLVPEEVQDKRITWEVSDPGMASVDQDGTVHFNSEQGSQDGTASASGRKTGDIKITATISSGKSKSYTLHLYDPGKTEILPVESITPERDSLTLQVGEYAQMTLDIQPHPCQPSLTYESTRESVAEVDDIGVVKAVAPGTCTIQITDDNTAVKTSYKVTVTGGPDDKTDSDSPSKSTDDLSKKLANPMTVKAKKVTLKARKLEKKARTIRRKKAITVKKAKGKVTYKLVSVKKSRFKKYFKVKKKNGKITVKKGLEKGTYKLKIKVTAAGNALYEKASKKVTVKVKVK